MRITTLRITRTAEHGIIWHDRMLSELAIFTRVANAETLHCYGCQDALRQIPEGAAWCYVPSVERYYCDRCYRQAKPALQERLQCKSDARRTIPRAINSVMRQIELHRHFTALSERDRGLYQRAVLLRAQGSCVGESNAYIRQLWRQLHYGDVSNQ